MSDKSKTGYNRLSQFFHWATALLIFITVPLGFYMVWIEPSSLKFDLYQWHCEAPLLSAPLFLHLYNLFGWLVKWQYNRLYAAIPIYTGVTSSEGRAVVNAQSKVFR